MGQPVTPSVDVTEGLRTLNGLVVSIPKYPRLILDTQGATEELGIVLPKTEEKGNLVSLFQVRV
jgi:hypothetical protein